MYQDFNMEPLEPRQKPLLIQLLTTLSSLFTSLAHLLFKLIKFTPKLLSPKDAFLLYIQLHRFILFEIYDPLKSIEKISSGRLKVTSNMLYLPITIFALTYLYGCFGLEENLSWETAFDIDLYQTSPYPFIHQIFHPTTWENMDICIAVVGFAMFGSIFATMALNPMISPRYWMFLYEERSQLPFDLFDSRQILGAIESVKIAKYKRQFKAIVIGIFVYFYFACILYASVFLWVYGRYEHFHLRQYIYWPIIFPIMLFYYVFGTISVLLYNSYHGQYVLIRKKVLLERMRSLNLRLSRRRPDLRFRYFQSATYWYEYLANNAHLMYICQQTAEYARFWMPYLSIMMVGFLSNLSYLVYVLFFIRNVTWIQNLVLYPITFNMISSLFLMTSQSAKLVRSNGALLKENRRFLYLAGPYLRQIPVCLLKTETFHVPHSLRPYCFKLFGNYRITSNSFNMIISTAVGYFMLVFKKKIIHGDDGKRN